MRPSRTSRQPREPDGRSERERERLPVIEDRAEDRAKMVELQLSARGIVDPAVLRAMRRVPREVFVPRELTDQAYSDRPLPIGEGQTISQPFVVAAMAQALQLNPSDRVLEVGAGTGYAAAVLSRIAAQVYAVEIRTQLADLAMQNLEELGYDNVEVRYGNGSVGWLEHAPYQGILVSAGAPAIPEMLQRQLSIGGRLVIPVGPTPMEQVLLRVVRVDEEDWRQDELDLVCFVPLVGEQGWPGRSGG